MSIEVRTAGEIDAKAVETDAKIAATDAKAVETDAKAVETDAKAAATDAKAIQTDAKIVSLESKIDALTPPIEPPPPPPPPPVAEAEQLYVQMDEGAGGAHWINANNDLKLPWVRPGGDWLDADNILHGPTPFFTLTIPAATAGYYSWDVIGIVQRMLDGPRHWNDSGFYLKGNAGSGSVGWAPKEDTTLNKPSLLMVVTTTGTFNPPLVLDTYLATTGMSQGLSTARVRLPSMLQFDLSGITGTLVSATLQTWLLPPSGTYPRSVGLYQLASPAILTSPATQGGTVDHGLAAKVFSSDAELGDNLWHPIDNPTAPVIIYNDLSSEAQIWADWEYADNENDPPDTSGQGLDNWTRNARGQSVFEVLPQYGGISLARVVITTKIRTGCALRHLAVDGNLKFPGPPPSYRREFTDPGFQELYFRYLLRIDPNVKVGHNENGTKMAGVDATYGLGPAYSGSTGQYDVGDSKWSYRTEHGKKSLGNPGLYRGFIYAYDWVVAQTGSDIGDYLYWDSASGQFCFQDGRIYCVELHVKLNTQNETGEWQANGVLEVWIDGVKVLSINDRMIRQHVNAQPNAIPFLNCYHGGTQNALADIHYWYGGVCVSREYIGPPRLITKGV